MSVHGKRFLIRQGNAFPRAIRLWNWTISSPLPSVKTMRSTGAFAAKAPATSPPRRNCTCPFSTLTLYTGCAERGASAAPTVIAPQRSDSDRAAAQNACMPFCIFILSFLFFCPNYAIHYNDRNTGRQSNPFLSGKPNLIRSTFSRFPCDPRAPAIPP